MKVNYIKVIYHSFKYGFTDPYWDCHATWSWWVKRANPFSKFPVNKKLRWSIVCDTYRDYCFIPYLSPDKLDSFYCWSSHFCSIKKIEEYAINYEKLIISDDKKELIMKHPYDKKFNGRWVKTKLLEKK